MSTRRGRVLFVTSWYPTAESPTHGTFIREHARAAACHTEVQVLHARFSTGGYLPKLGRELSPELTRGLPTLRLDVPRPAPKSGYVSFGPSLLWAYSQVVRSGFRPDLIHANVYETALPAVALGLLHDIPVVVAEHSSAFALGTVPPAQLKASRWAFPRADRILPVSRFLDPRCSDAVSKVGSTSYRMRSIRESSIQIPKDLVEPNRPAVYCSWGG